MAFTPLDPRAFKQFISQAQIKLPGASDAGIKVELFDVLKEFFNDSNSWREDIFFSPVVNSNPPNLPFQTGTPDSQDYVLVPLEQGQIFRLVAVWDDKGIPIPAVMPTFGTIHLIHPVTTAPSNQWVARVNKTVTLPLGRDDVPIVPDWTLGVYSVDILDGLLGKMMGQQDKSFSNGELSTYHLRRFRTAIQKARTASIRENGVGYQEWCYPRGTGISSSQRGGVSTAWPTRAF